MAPETSGELRTHRAHGASAVTLTPLPAYHDAADARLGQRAIDKRFEGDLTGVSRSEMISVGTTVQDSAAYSVLERAFDATGAARSPSSMRASWHGAPRRSSSPSSRTPAPTHSPG